MTLDGTKAMPMKKHYLTFSSPIGCNLRPTQKLKSRNILAPHDNAIGYLQLIQNDLNLSALFLTRFTFYNTDSPMAREVDIFMTKIEY